jgi:hypothetical protein
MNCALACSLIDEYLEDGLSQRDRQVLEKHLDLCRGCAEELRGRPAFERQMRRALAASVRPLYLSSDASGRIVEAAEATLQKAVMARRAKTSFTIVLSAVAAALLIVSIWALVGGSPVPLGLRPTELLPLSSLFLSESEPVTLSAEQPPEPRLTSAYGQSLPRASFRMDPRDMQPHEPFTLTVFLESDMAQPLDALALDLDIRGPTGFYRFGLALKGPLPAHGVSIFRVTPDLLADACQQQYLMVPTEMFGAPGVYSLRFTLFDPVSASP